VVENLKIPQPTRSERKVDEALLKTVEKAVYGCVLGAFIQGLEVGHSSS
jgi:6-phosphogluconate dehydrogenase